MKTNAKLGHMLIREATVGDIKNIRRLYAQLNPDDPEVTDGRDLATLATIENSKWLLLFVGLIHDRIVATCYLNVIPNLSRDASPYGLIENVVVDLEFRNEGYGKEIMRHALDRAWKLGCYKVMLQTGSKRESTHKFYESCGFSADDKLAFVAYPK